MSPNTVTLVSGLNIVAGERGSGQRTIAAMISSHAQTAALLLPVILLSMTGLCHSQPMCFRITATGSLLPLSSRSEYDEVMLHCARIGYKP